MALAPGTRIGSYDIVAPLGAGGMGEVYRARDSQLKREVALKLLPENVAKDPERLARFEREAQVLASLNHPNIAALHGMERGSEASGPVLVMELVDGPTLADRIAQGPVPLDEAMSIARELAAGLDAAHGHGVVHRDLKPANIKLTAEGAVKILDFGLAKAIQSPGSIGDGSQLANSPTMTSPAMTQAGVILGTAAYMSPEQARGHVVDKRADIWAFGCVFYEMLTGTCPFGGDDLTLTLASIVRDSPDLSATPAAARRLLEKCLQKDPRQRLRDIGDAFDLVAASPNATAAPARVTRWLPWAITTTALVAAALVAMPSFKSAPPEPPMRFEVAWPRQSSAASDTGNYYFELSPDGQYIAIVSDGALWVRKLSDVEPVKLERTEDATYPFWSPDSQSIAFFSNNQLKRVSRNGGSVQRVCAAVDARGGTWGRSGMIVFSDRGGIAGVSRVSANGGEPTAVTRVSNPSWSRAHRYPRFLPDGKHFLFLWIDSDPAVAGVYVASTETDQLTRVLPGRESAMYVDALDAGGHLLFVRDARLMAQPFDATNLRLTGPEFVVSDAVSAGQNTGDSRYSASQAGILAYGTFNVPRNLLVWFDRNGTRSASGLSEAIVNAVAMAPDDRRVVLAIAEWDGRSSDLWLQSERGRPLKKLTYGPTPGWTFPVWSPRGDRIAFSSANSMGYPQYEVRTTTISDEPHERTLFQSAQLVHVADWMPDGNAMVLSYGGNLWLADAAGEQPHVRLLETNADADFSDAQVSPDGRWLAYSIVDADKQRVFVQLLRDPSRRFLLTPEGGSMPRWRRNGGALFYRGPDGKLREATLHSSRSMVETVDVRTLPIVVPASGNTFAHTYVPSVDASRFLVLLTSSERWAPMTVVVNWQRGRAD